MDGGGGGYGEEGTRDAPQCRSPGGVADVSAMHANYDNYPAYSSSSSSYDSLEGGLYNDGDGGILPGWLASTSRWTKAVVVLSAAVIFGALVLGTVAVVASVTQNNDLNGGAEEVNDPNAVEEFWGVVTPEGGPPVELPRLDLTTGPPTGSPVGTSEETGESGGTWGESKVPTYYPTTATPTDAPTDEPTELPTDPPASAAPTVTGSPTAQASSTPSADPTSTPGPTASLAPSMSGTLSPTATSGPTLAASSTPSADPSSVPTATSSPSWELGADALNDEPLTFFLMADSGNNVDYWTDRLSRLRVEKHQFLFHLGSATRGVDNCTEDSYNATATSLLSSPLPVWSTPGNRDWLGCPDPDLAWEKYERHFVTDLDARRGDEADGIVVRRQPGRPENYAFVSHRVLFVGVNAVTNSDSPEPNTLNVTHNEGRWEDNVAWLKANVEEHTADAVRAVFVTGYGRLLDPSAAPLYDAMKEMKGEGGPLEDRMVVYARRAGEESELVRDVEGTPGLHELRVGSGWPLVDVKIEPDGGGTLGPEGDSLVGWRLALDPQGGGGGGGKDGPK